ncbi:MAG: Smr/MutS family protein [Proteobacteria bacterium]|nr:Smr/MutS family protein [Pseudomonadota bacterium]
MVSKKTSFSDSASSLLTEDEKELLKKLQKTITPLKKNTIDLSALNEVLSLEKKYFSRFISSSPPPFIASSNISLPKKQSSLETPVPPLEKHTLRKIKSKDYSFSATLDLHGLTQERAHEKLISFIEMNHLKNKRSLLIITGKGQGILKKALLLWLQSPHLRPLIASVEQALSHHGGEGAFYVILRKKKDH